MQLEPIGVIHTPFGNAALAPRQTHQATGARGYAVLTEAYREGLRALDGFDYVHLIVRFDRAPSPQMTVEPLYSSAAGLRVGLFATRHPARPNRIGLSLVKLERLTEEGFEFSGVDLLNGTPLLDIKPYEPTIDSPWTLPVRSGWYAQVAATSAVDHSRNGHSAEQRRKAVLLLNAQALHRSLPDAFPYAPSHPVLSAVRPGMKVRIRAAGTSESRFLNVWDSHPLWAEVEGRTDQLIHARVGDGVLPDGLSAGDLLDVSPENVFDFYGPDQWFNPERLPTLIGRTVLVGITVVSHEGVELESRQLHGRIQRMDLGALVVELTGGEVLHLPPTFALLDEAPPGDYRLRTSGEVVVKPDLTAVVTIALSPGTSKWSGPRKAG